MPAKSNCPRSSSRSGELSNSDLGGGSSQPPDIMASAQCMPERMTVPLSARNTWPTWKLRQTRSRLPTATRNRSACTAIAVAFTAPAEVPVTTGNGLTDRAGSRSAIARNTPT